MANLNWYWRRLRAMGPVEVALRLRKKWFEFKDAKRDQWPSADLSASSVFPKGVEDDVAGVALIGRPARAKNSGVSVSAMQHKRGSTR